MKKFASSIACILLATNVYSQPIIDNSTKWIKDQSEKSKSALADRPADLNALIAGNWHDKVQVTVNSFGLKPSQRDQHAYSWIGDFSIHIQKNGKLSFTMSNGCKYNGDYVTFASDTAWSVEGQFENCVIPTLNRRIIGRITKKNERIFLTLTQTGVTIDPQVAVSIRTTYLTRD